MDRREAMLRELHLYPLWQLRQHEAAATPAPAADTEPVPAPVPADTAVKAGTTIKADTVVTPLRSPAASGEAVAAPAPAVEESGSREQQISRLDWPELKQMVRDCSACRLRAGCTQTVFGVGDEQADWLFIGEGPGADEDIQGEPFVGQAGKLLDSMLAAIRLKRGDNVYIGNIVKCRPPSNRNPAADEIATCYPYLRRQVELIRPKLIIALGKVAATTLLGRDATLGSMRGKLHDYHGIPLLVTYHPAYLLRSPLEKAKAWQDLCRAVRVMREGKTE